MMTRPVHSMSAGVLLLAGLLGPPEPIAMALSMPVEEAYRAIPHRRTVFDPQSATMSSAERRYLAQLFRWMDLAVVARVESLKSLQRGQPTSLAEYDRIVGGLSALKVPPPLTSVHGLIVEAIEEQRRALEMWQRRKTTPTVADDPLVQSSSAKLRQAYTLLMQLFPGEGRHNQEAFYDYLCALDFV